MSRDSQNDTIDLGEQTKSKKKGGIKKRMGIFQKEFSIRMGGKFLVH